MLPRASPQIGVLLAWPPTANFAAMTTWTRRRVSVATVSGHAHILAIAQNFRHKQNLGTRQNTEEGERFV